MSTFRSLLLVAFVGVFAAGIAQAQPAPTAQPAPAQKPTPTPTAPAKADPNKPVAPGSERLSDADLDEMLAPIALYPDGLLANVLAASIYPDEVKAAGELVAKGGTKEQINAQAWEEPVKAIAIIPDALKMMTQYMDWTRALGEAYVIQSQGVMAAVQRLRARAQQSGSLKTSEQQTVATQGDTIIIQQSDPEVVYVPSYNPVYVYEDHDDEWAAGIIGFGLGIACGAAIWGCDWHGGGVCWGGGWGDVDIDIDNNFNIDNDRINNIGNNNNRPGREGQRWQPNQSKMDRNLAQGRPQNLNNFRGSGTRPATGNVPGRAAGSKPIASQPTPRTAQSRGGAGGAGAAQRPAGAGGAGAAGGGGRGGAGGAGPSARPAPAKPDAMPINRPAAPKSPSAKPAIPPTRSPSGGGGYGGGGAGGGGGRQPTAPAARPSQSSRSSNPSAFNSGGSSRSAASRGGASRSGGSRGGGGRGGGGRR